MKSLISINSKFMNINPKYLLDIIRDESIYTKGVEICINYENENEFVYLKQIANYCREYEMLFQVHGDSKLSIEKQIEFVKYLENISDHLGYPITLTLHSIYDDDNKISIIKTEEYLHTLIDNINLNKINIAIENLNDSPGLDRLDKMQMLPILFNNEHLHMTYDIGHEIADFGQITNIDANITSRIINVHLHEVDEIYFNGFDHKPIHENDKNFDKILKGIMFLKSIKYDKTVVFEYDLNACIGNTIQEKIKDYLYSIDETSRHM